MASALIAFTLIAAPGECLGQAKPKPAAAAKPPRVLFVLDDETLEPLAGAVVRDVITRNSMKTSVDGAVGLFVPAFVKKTGALMEVSLDGYQRSDRVLVDPLGDTSAVVVTLVREGARPQRIAEDSVRRAIPRLRADSTTLQIVVLSEAGPPLSDAQIVVSRPDSTVLATRTSDSTGLRTMVLPDVSGHVQITVRKVGYRLYSHTVRLSDADTFVAPVQLRRVAQTLAGVRVVARKNLYHLDEGDIEDANRKFSDALEVLRELRPSMFGDRLRHVPGCGTASNIWVNGIRITFPPINVTPPALPRAGQSKIVFVGMRDHTLANGKVVKVRHFKQLPAIGEAAAMPLVRAVLAGIKPEHVAEMTYSDCFDTTFAKLHTNNAIFVVLKSGFEYDVDRGSIPNGRESSPP